MEEEYNILEIMDFRDSNLTVLSFGLSGWLAFLFCVYSQMMQEICIRLIC